MSKNTPELENLHIVPEEMIIYCARQFSEDEDNAFKRFLEFAREFRAVGLTPIFLSTERLEDLMITSQEKLEKKLH